MAYVCVETNIVINNIKCFSFLILERTRWNKIKAYCESRPNTSIYHLSGIEEFFGRDIHTKFTIHTNSNWLDSFKTIHGACFFNHINIVDGFCKKIEMLIQDTLSPKNSEFIKLLSLRINARGLPTEETKKIILSS